MLNLDYMWQTLLDVQANVDDLKKDLLVLEADEVTSSMIATVLGYRRRKLSDTVEKVSQLTEALLRNAKSDAK